MLMTTQNSVSHMAYLLEPGCKRWKSGDTNAPERSAFPTFLEAIFAGKTRGIDFFTTQSGSMNSGRPIEDANRARGILDKCDVTSAATRYAHQAVHPSRCPYSSLRMRTAGYRSACAGPEPAPTIGLSAPRCRSCDTCRDIALIRASRCEAAPASHAETDRADC